jgi:hypothetical protein
VLVENLLAESGRTDDHRVVDGRGRTDVGRTPVPQSVSHHPQERTAGHWSGAEVGGTVTERLLRRETGQTFTETAMILGILTAIIIGLTGTIVPGFSRAIAGLVKHMLIYVGTAR